jgi:hypothetical protein
MERRESTPCIHRWLLGEPHNGSIEGICRRCGARRTYPSGLELPETIPDYEELDRSHPVLTMETASLEEHSLV